PRPAQCRASGSGQGADPSGLPYCRGRSAWQGTGSDRHEDRDRPGRRSGRGHRRGLRGCNAGHGPVGPGTGPRGSVSAADRLRYLTCLRGRGPLGPTGDNQRSPPVRGLCHLRRVGYAWPTGESRTAPLPSSVRATDKRVVMTRSTIRPNMVITGLCGTLTSMVVIGLARLAYGIILPSLRADLGLSYQTAGILGTITAPCYGCFVLSRGLAAARWGARASVLFGLGIVVLGFAGLTLASSFRLIALLMGLLGFG